MNVVLYTRVSTTKQDYDSQYNKLKKFCEINQYNIIREYKETISGKESNRLEFRKMMKDAMEKKFQAIIVYALDRFTREGPAKVFQYISVLDKLNIKFISCTEPYLNTDNELTRDITLSIMGVFAKQERMKIVQRTKDGLDAALKRGVKLGKPPINGSVKETIIAMRKKGMSLREIQKNVFYWDEARNRKTVSLGFVHKTLSEK